nr:unnamed protein product [Digitaria exilis]
MTTLLLSTILAQPRLTLTGDPVSTFQNEEAACVQFVALMRRPNMHTILLHPVLGPSKARLAAGHQQLLLLLLGDEDVEETHDAGSMSTCQRCIPRPRPGGLLTLSVAGGGKRQGDGRQEDHEEGWMEANLRRRRGATAAASLVALAVSCFSVGAETKGYEGGSPIRSNTEHQGSESSAGARKGGRFPRVPNCRSRPSPEQRAAAVLCNSSDEENYHQRQAVVQFSGLPEGSNDEGWMGYDQWSRGGDRGCSGCSGDGGGARVPGVSLYFRGAQAQAPSPPQMWCVAVSRIPLFSGFPLRYPGRGGDLYGSSQRRRCPAALLGVDASRRPTNHGALLGTSSNAALDAFLLCTAHSG